MDLRLKDIVKLLNVPEKKIHQWIKEKNMPAHKIKSQYYFNKAEISEWLLQNDIAVSSNILNLGLTSNPVSILELINKGGIYYDIIGSSIKDIINNIADTIRIPAGTTKENVKESLLQREEMMTTAVGYGIAFPHPRNPIISDVDDESVSLCFLKNAIDYSALDGKPVNVLFVIISSNSKRHLEILSKLSFLCRQEDFVKMLNHRPKIEVIHYYIEQKEKEWSKR
jgi:PTS system nitrogen regulatory IIA component